MPQPAFLSGVGIVGVQWPWSPTGPQEVSGFELIETAIGLVVYTVIYEHKMEPSFGTNIGRVVFENIGPPLEAIAQIELTNAFANWLPDLTIESVKMVPVEARSADEEGRVDVDVSYTWQGITNSVTLTPPPTPPT